MQHSITKALLVITFLFLGILAYGQPYEKITYRIDSLTSSGLPKSALQEVDRLDALAHQRNNAPQIIRAVIYRITLQSYLEENALVPIINTLKADIQQSSYPVKPVLQSLLAEMYWRYYEQNRWQFKDRTRLEKPDPDLTRWDLRTIITETSLLYRASLQQSARLQQTPVSVLNGVLSGDAATRYLRPTLYDLLLHRAFVFYLADEPALPKPRMPFRLNDERLFGSSRAFARLVLLSADTASTWYQGLCYLQQATLFHLRHNDAEALADLDLGRLEFLYSKATLPGKDSLYLHALRQTVEEFANKPIAADALVLSGKYYQQKDSLLTAMAYLQKALKQYPGSIGAENANRLIKQIQQKTLLSHIENVNVPGKPILGLLEYKNIAEAKLQLYRLNQSGYEEYQNLYTRANRYNWQHNENAVRADSVLHYLKKQHLVQQQTLHLPAVDDYRKHGVEFGLPALPAGSYVLLISEAGTSDSTYTHLAEVKVSSLAYVVRRNPDNRIELRVMNRESGAPLKGVKVVMNDDDKAGTTNSAGLFRSEVINDRSNDWRLSYRGDTLNEEHRYVYGRVTRDDDSDEKAEKKTLLFTDRQIYRPGQTIYFKGMQLQMIKDKSKLLVNDTVEVSFNDPNGKELNSLTLQTNDYGTFSGTFSIPQTILNGEVTLETDDGELRLRVEEYKRPTFRVDFASLSGRYHLNDTLRIKGRVTAFAGYGLSKARVAYHITRTLAWRPYPYAFYGSGYRYEAPAEIAADTLLADAQGNFTIKFKSVPGESALHDAVYEYALSADATDAGGESQSGQLIVKAGWQDINISTNAPAYLFANAPGRMAVQLNNLNGQGLKGSVRVQMNALQAPSTLYKNRLWNKPDQHLINAAEFRQQFPEYPYNREDEYSTWPQQGLVFEKDTVTEVAKSVVLDLKMLSKQPSGIYRLLISARRNEGDTTSIIRYIRLINQPSTIADLNNWVIPVVNAVHPGEKAEFLAGIGPETHLLVEQYRDSTITSSKWITQQEQHSIEVPVSKGDPEKTAVQLMMVYHNRLYSSYQPIFVQQPEKELNIKLLSFRNLLRLGEKEQWKLQITNGKNQRQAAELLAAMYDASLDDIAQPQDWQNMSFTGNRYNTGNYFEWNRDFVNAVNDKPVFNEPYYYASLVNHDYEKLNWFGYNYYGGYNYSYRSYIQNMQNRQKRREEEAKRQQETYEHNAALVKNGVEVTGRVIDKKGKDALPGVSIRIKGTSIATNTNMEGYFKIKVPLNGVLQIKYIGYQSKELIITQAEAVTVGLEAESNALGEVAVVGYGVQAKREMTYYASASIRINGKDFTGSDKVTIAQGLSGRVAGVSVSVAEAEPNEVFTAVSITNPDGSKIVNGKRIPASSNTAPVTTRKNFNETAFFFPQLHTDENGEILIDFTLPESLTKWRFKALAHTRELANKYLQQDVIAQKQLMVSATMPRFMREGDTIVVAARVANLSAQAISTQVTLQLFNGLNMQPIDLLANPAEAEQQVEVAANTSKAVSFKLIVPAGLDALTYRLTAAADKYSDGEENTLPVLPNRMLVTESMPMMVRAGQTKAFTFDKLVNQHSSTLVNKTLTLEYTQNPAWYAVQAMPYLMEFPYECSEQTFSRYFANSLSASIVNHNPQIKQVFERWKSADNKEMLSDLEKNPELKATLLEETPWLRDAMNEQEQRKRIALLFDLAQLSAAQDQALDKLQKKQLPDGGFPWFGGDRADRYITQHIIAGIGQLNSLKLAGSEQQKLNAINTLALRYLDNQLMDDHIRAAQHNVYYKTAEPSAIEIHGWYARSYFANAVFNKELKEVQDIYLNRAAKHWQVQSVYEQGMIALTMLRYGRADVSRQIIRSLLETAHQSEEMGMYWSKNQLGWYWYESPVETQALLIELFTEAGNQPKAIEEMKIWLLRNKQTNSWRTTKATAEACYALLMRGDTLLGTSGNSTIKLNNQPLTELKSDIKAEAGTGYFKTSWTDGQIQPTMGRIEVNNNGQTVSWGALHWQYTEQLDKITPSTTDIHLERKYFIVKQSNAGDVLSAVDATHQPKTGDLLKVVVYLKAGRDYEYIQLKDMRPAGTEPVDALSEYKYQDGLYYYQVTKDVATNFFISRLNKGSYVFEYRLRVVQLGNFSTGISTVQSMYAPQFNAHSEGRRLIIGQ